MIRKLDENMIISENTLIATSFCNRLFGLTIRRFNKKFDGIVFLECNLIHSCFMLYKFDLIFVDKVGKVVKLYQEVKPFRVCYGGGIAKDLTAIEVPKGTIKRCDIRVGNSLSL